jgi:hypothetical protein
MEVKRQNIIFMRTPGDWICAIVSLISGCIAYINCPDFLHFNPSMLGGIEVLQKMGEIAWAALVAGVTTVSGLATKYWWDKKGKRMIDKLFRKKRR